MTKITLDTMSDHSEIVHYDTPGIPLYIQKGILSEYTGKRAQCHWHDDIELILILDGSMNYYVNGITTELKKEEGIFINTREMHYGYSASHADCTFLCILFHPSLLSSCRKTFNEWVSPLLEQPDFSYLHLQKPEHSAILQLIQDIWQFKESQDPYYPFMVIGALYSLWACVSHIQTFHDSTHGNELSSDVTALRQMVSFLHSHYQEKITLQAIADAANICKSKCCTVFKKQTGQSPFDFLNHYRLNVSANLLTNTSKSVSEIALECGFNHLSYYSKLFMRYYGCSPRAYRLFNKPD